MGENPSIAVTPKSVIDKYGTFLDTRRTSLTPYFGVWVERECFWVLTFHKLYICYYMGCTNQNE
jgi:hypothetical protein